mmetsp:Transcript_30420/g.59746  ORF Transcript_30420/g.59746 Transcript_30420/m.59746 type:complete len:113 (-) Transcript_30420:235-573(-)
MERTKQGKTKSQTAHDFPNPSGLQGSQEEHRHTCRQANKKRRSEGAQNQSESEIGQMVLFQHLYLIAQGASLAAPELLRSLFFSLLLLSPCWLRQVDCRLGLVESCLRLVCC